MVNPEDPTRTVEETVQAFENVEVKVIDSDVATAHVPEWPALPPEARTALIEAGEVPHTVQRSRNTTCVGLHELIAEALDGSVPPVDAVGMELEIGSGTATPDSSNTELNEHVTSVDVTTFNRNGAEIETVTHVGPNTANGHTLEEAGLSLDGRLLNHSLLSSAITKDESTEANITAVLSTSAA